VSDDWSDDPFADPNDPRGREREERRLEREEKRRQRAAKRAEKAEAAAPPPPEPPPPAEPPKPPRTPEEEFWDEDPPTPEPEAPPAAAGAEAGAAETAEPDARPRAAEPPPQRPEPDPVPLAAAPEPPAPEPVTPEPAQEQSWEHDFEPRQAPAEDWGFHEEGDPELADAAKGGRGGGGRRGGILGALGRHPFRVVGVVLGIVVVWLLFSLFQPFHGDGSGRVEVTIPKGSSVSEVGDLLDEKGVISSSTFFQIRVTVEGKRSDLYAGHFTLARDMSYGSAIDALSTPPAKPNILTVTIPEGYSRPQAAQLVEEDGVGGSYTKATVKSKFLDPARYGGKGAKDLEGFLFPDTYEMKRSQPVADLVQLQLKRFKEQIGKVDMKYANSKNLTVFDVVTIASMIEREAGVAKQRKLVASVIYNRLHEGMPLGIDATTRFAVGNYTKPLTESELATDSPYNTRTNAGLPPGPIDSPGLEALQAAAHPAKTDYLFYVNKPNTCNELAFSADEAEWQEDVAAYEQAREANGGNEPSSC
jgi:UPF0755 protein